MTTPATALPLPASGPCCGSPSHSHLGSAASLLAADVFLLKAAAVPEWAITIRLENRYMRAATLDWSRRAQVAIASTVKWMEGLEEVTEAHAKEAPERLIRAFVGWPSKPLLKLMGSALTTIAQLAKQATVKKIEGTYQRSLVVKAALAPSLNLEDKKAAEWLIGSQKFWLLDHFDTTTVNAIRSSAYIDIQGLPGKEAADKLRKLAEKAYGVGAFDHLGKGYFEGVAVNAATTARVNSGIITMKGYGVQSYILVNPNDERTSEICKAMDGKELFVSDAHDQLTSMMASTSPDDIKKLHGWEPHTFKDTLAAKGVTLTPGKSLSLADRHTVGKAGFALPPYHWLCRTMVDIGSGGTSGTTGPKPAPPPAAAPVPPPAPVSAPPPPPAPAPPPAPVPIPAPTPVAPPVVAPPVVPVAPPVPVAAVPKPIPVPKPKVPKVPKVVQAPPAPVLPAGFPWRADQMKSLGSGKHLGGAHSKVILEAPDGSKWLFKPNTHLAPTPYVGEGEKFAASLAKKLGQPTADLHVIELPQGHAGLVAMGHGSKPITGSIQKMADVKGVIGTTPLDQLTEAQLLHIQREHVFDWLISNHDGHEDNHLFLGDGSLLGIDKGQAFKYFGKDRWAPDYSPNAAGNSFIPYYNRMFGRYANGEFTGLDLRGPDDNPALMAFLKSIKDMDEDEFIALVSPYSSAAVKSGIKWGPKGWNESQFQYELLLRKEKIIDDARAYYAELEKSRARFNIPKPVAGPAPKVKAPPKPKGPKTVTVIDKKLTKKVHDSGLHGASIHVAGSNHIRSGNILVFGMEGDGTVGEMYLSPEGDAALKKMLGQLGGNVAVPSLPTGADPYHDQVLQAVKSLNAHLVATTHSQYDGKVPQKTWDLLQKLHQELGNLAYDSSGNTVGDNAEQALHYLTYLKSVTKGSHLVDDHIVKDNLLALKAAGAQLTKHVPRPSAPPPNLVTGLANALEVKAVRTREWDVALAGGGKLKFKSLAGLEHGGGDSFEITIKGSKPPIKFLYVQHGDHNKTSRVGRLRMFIDKDSAKLDPSDLEDGLEALKKLGLNADLATEKDVEMLYLRKVTRIAKLDKDPAFQVPSGATSEEAADKLAAAWSKRMGVKDVRKLPNYAPDPIYDGPDSSGRARWERFDITEEDIRRAGMDLKMSLTSDANAGEFFGKAVPGGTKAMVSTESRLRVGIPVTSGQMSAQADMDTGGAERVFTRIGNTDTEKAEARIMRFDGRMLLDADAITYDTDHYGRLSLFDTEHRGTSMVGMIAARGGGYSSNETIFKYDLSWNYLKDVGVNTALERKALLDYLAANGVTHFGKRPVADVIKLAGTPLSK